MPRLPVDGKKVQEFRITLGTFERERVDTLISALTFNKVSTPLVALLSDVSAMTTIVSAYLVYKYGPDALQYLKQDAYEDVTGLASDALSAVASLPVISQTLGVADFIGNLAGGQLSEENYGWLQALGLVPPLPGS
tara:strand:+ start:2902 stop:3309 length:408 start_codon:yes stop_codon:yes gene_type:complete